MLIQEMSAMYCSAILGTKIFAICNMLVTAVASLVSLCLGAYWIDMILLQAPNYIRRWSVMWSYYGFEILASVVISLVAVPFAVYLFNGVFKKIPRHITIYYTYGGITNILSIIAVGVYMIMSDEKDPLIICSSLVLCFLYFLVLVMIRKTHKIYCREELFKNTLINTIDVTY